MYACFDFENFWTENLIGFDGVFCFVTKASQLILKLRQISPV